MLTPHTLLVTSVINFFKKNIFYLLFFITSILVSQTVSVSETKLCEESSFYLSIDDYSPTVYERKWQFSSDELNWSDLDNNFTYSGVNGLNLNFTNAPYSLSNNYYRCLLDTTDDGLFDVISSNFQLSLLTKMSASTIDNGQQVCYNSIPEKILTTTPPTGGDGVYTYQWYQSSDASNWNKIDGATENDYQPSNLTSTTYYRVECVNFCNSVFSNVSEVTVFPDVFPGKISDNQTLCYGGLANALGLVQVPSGGGSSDYTYQWQKSDDGLVWTDIEGEITANYSPGNLTETAYFRMQTRSNFGCGPVATNSVKIEVYEALVSGVINGEATQCYNKVPDELTFSTLPTGVDGNYTYQWQESTDLLTWNNIDGATSTSYQDEALTTTKHYRAIVSSTFGCSSVTTNVITVNVYSEFTAGVINEVDAICYNSIPDLISTSTPPTGGDGSYTYQWYVSSDASNWELIDGATNIDYQPSTLTSTTFYKIAYINSCKTLFSNVSKVTVYPDVFPGKIGENQTLCYGGLANSLGLIQIPSGGGSNNYNYQWQKSDDDLVWNDIEGATTANYSPSNLTQTTYFRLQTSSDYGCGPIATNSTKIEVYEALIPGVISGEAIQCYNTVPEELTFSTLPTGVDGDYTYQWQESTDLLTWSDIDGATSTSYQDEALTATKHYRTIVSSTFGCDSETTNLVTVTVYAEFITGIISEVDAICYNSIPDLLTTTTLPTGGDGSYTYQWFVSSDQLNWSEIDDATDKDYQPSNLSSTTYYKVAYTNTCNSKFSNVSEVTVFPDVFPGLISENQTLCYGGLASTLELTQLPSGGGSSIYNYQWQQSANGSTWEDLEGETDVTYSPGNLTQTTYYRLQTSSDYGCGPSATNTIEVEVYDALTSGEIVGETICYNTVPEVLKFSVLPTGVDSDYTYQWQESTDLTTWSDIEGATSTSYQAEALTTTTHYRTIVSSTFGCDSETTNSVSVTVYPEFITGVISEVDAICYNSIPDVLTTTTLPTGGDGSYTYQWYVSSDELNWSEIDGATDKDYQASNLSSTTYYKVAYINTCNSKFSNVSEVTVFPDVFPGVISENQTLCYGGLASTLELTQLPSGGGSSIYNYQWQQSLDGSTWEDLEGETAVTYSPGNLTQTTYYKLQTTSDYGCGPAATNTIEVEVYDALTSGEIVGETICYNTVPEVLTFSVLPTGVDGDYTYQWQESTDLTTWNDIEAATTTSYQPDALTTTTHYRTIVSSTFGCASEITNSVSITVYPEFITGVINEVAPICYNFIPDPLTTTILPTGGDGSYSYQWYVSSDKSNWSEIDGATDKDYQPSNLTSTTYYKLAYINTCNSKFSNISEVVVNSLPDDVTILGEQKVCANSIDVVYKASIVNQFYSYEWQCTNGEIISGKNTTECIINWDNSPGVVGTVYLEQTVDSTGCSKITSLPIEISEYIAPNATNIIRKPNTNILIAEDASDGLIYQWGYDIKSTGNSVTIEGSNLRYVLVPQALNLDAHTYWVKTSYLNDDASSCETYSYFDPNTEESIEESIVQKIRIYPNPAYGTIYLDNINLKKAKVKVYATNGRSINFVIDTEGALTLDKSAPPGIYLLRVTDSGLSINKKIILK